MPEGYCVKCKSKKDISGAVEVTMKNGRKAIKGVCPSCGAAILKFLGADSEPTSSEPTSTH